MLLFAILQSLQCPPFDSEPFPCGLHKVPQSWCSDLQQSDPLWPSLFMLLRWSLCCPSSQKKVETRDHWTYQGQNSRDRQDGRCWVPTKNTVDAVICRSVHTHTHINAHMHRVTTSTDTHTDNHKNIFTYTYVPIRTHTLYPVHRQVPTETHINMSLIPKKTLCFSLGCSVPVVRTLRDLAQPGTDCLSVRVLRWLPDIYHVKSGTT